MEEFKRIFKRQSSAKPFNKTNVTEVGEEKSDLFSSWTNNESYDDLPNPNRSVQNFYLDDEEEDIPIIPDIEEIQNQDFIEQTADAPAVEFRPLENLEELDKKVLKHPVLSSIDNNDLSVLFDFCLPEEKIKESDVTWSWDSLIADIMYNVDLPKLNTEVTQAMTKR